MTASSHWAQAFVDSAYRPGQQAPPHVT